RVALACISSHIWAWGLVSGPPLALLTSCRALRFSLGRVTLVECRSTYGYLGSRVGSYQ
ncbi:hypothetical protein LINPERHAP1_LOCUS4562, partial [Linum perenne]